MGTDKIVMFHMRKYRISFGQYYPNPNLSKTNFAINFTKKEQDKLGLSCAKLMLCKASQTAGGKLTVS